MVLAPASALLMFSSDLAMASCAGVSAAVNSSITMLSATLCTSAVVLVRSETAPLSSSIACCAFSLVPSTLRMEVSKAFSASLAALISLPVRVTALSSVSSWDSPVFSAATSSFSSATDACASDAAVAAASAAVRALFAFLPVLVAFFMALASPSTSALTIFASAKMPPSGPCPGWEVALSTPATATRMARTSATAPTIRAFFMGNPPYATLSGRSPPVASTMMFCSFICSAFSSPRIAP